MRRTDYEYHGMSNTPAYRSWEAMLRRCENPNDAQYHDYGGRGIRVCARWHSFVKFYADMGDRPEGKTLDRYPDKDGDYRKSNCRWASRKRQQNNMRSNVLMTFHGKTRSVLKWAKKLQIDPGLLYGRIHRGWSVEKTLSTPRIESRVRKHTD